MPQVLRKIINKLNLNLSDFGTAIFQDLKNAMTQSNGTNMYMSYQQKFTGKYTSKVDVYALGVIYFEILNGVGNTPIELDCTDQKTRKTNHFAIEEVLKKIEVSQLSIDFINDCLRFQEQDRLSWEKVFEHQIYKRKSFDPLDHQTCKYLGTSGSVKSQVCQNITRDQSIKVSCSFYNSPKKSTIYRSNELINVRDYQIEVIDKSERSIGPMNSHHGSILSELEKDEQSKQKKVSKNPQTVIGRQKIRQKVRQKYPQIKNNQSDKALKKTIFGRLKKQPYQKLKQQKFQINKRFSSINQQFLNLQNNSRKTKMIEQRTNPEAKPQRMVIVAKQTSSKNVFWLFDLLFILIIMLLLLQPPKILSDWITTLVTIRIEPIILQIV